MTDISTVRTDLLSIVGNNRMPIKTKRILIKRGLKAINTFIDLKPNKIYNLKKRKINKILLLLRSIKYNVDLKKLLTKELITDITDFENYPNIIFDKEDDTDKSNWREIKKTLQNKEIGTLLNKEIGTALVETEVESEENEDLDDNNYSDDSEENSVEDSEEDSNKDSDDNSDSDSDTEELDETVNNLVEDLSDDAKAKMIIKLTKYKLDNLLKMEEEKNRNMERMEELAIKKLKVQNKYKLKKLENRK